MLEIDAPTPSQQRWFGLILLAVFGVIGTMVGWQLEAWGASRVLWGFGLGLALLYTAVRPLQRPLYYAWMHMVFPIGWVVSHLALAIVFYGVVTPLGLVMRLFGRDKLERRIDPKAKTYWTERPADTDPSRYLRQS